jgi:uncharacterized membrane protein
MMAMSPVMMVHIAAGSVGLLSGAVALVARKGDRLHRRSGTVFFAAMLTMSALGAGLAIFAPSRMSILAGIFTFYLVATAWVTVKRRAGASGVFEVGALAFGLATGIAFLVLAWVAAHSPRGRLDGLPYQPAIVFGAVALLAAACDLRLILKSGIEGFARVRRHLWRMCAALFIASTSLFLGQPQVFPPPLHGSPLLMVPAFAPLALLAFWMLRTRAPIRFRPHAVPAE